MAARHGTGRVPDEVPHSTILSWLGPMEDDREVRRSAEDLRTYDSRVEVFLRLLPVTWRKVPRP